jgi:hypothetical protein
MRSMEDKWLKAYLKSVPRGTRTRKASDDWR